MSAATSSLEFESQDGEADLSERGEKREGVYRTTCLVDRHSRVSLRAFWQVEDSHGNSHEEPGVAIQMSVFHLENEETGRAFHSHLTFPLSKGDVRTLRDWFGFMLEHWEDMDR